MVSCYGTEMEMSAMRRWIILMLALLCLLTGCGEAEPAWTDPVPPNEYDREAFAVVDGFLSYAAGVSLVGVDVSTYQGEVDWKQAAKAGVQFAMIRAGYRGYTEGALFEDEQFRRNMEEALAAGLEVGVYFFSQAVTEEEAVEEARFVLELIEGYEIAYPVVFDWEKQEKETSRTRDTGGETMTACTIAFCEVIEEAGYLPMVYFSPSKGYHELNLEQLLRWPFWLAHYTPDWQFTSFKYDFAMWQYEDKGQVPGIEGNVDLNICLTDFSRWKSPLDGAEVEDK